MAEWLWRVTQAQASVATAVYSHQVSWRGFESPSVHYHFDFCDVVLCVVSSMNCTLSAWQHFIFRSGTSFTYIADRIVN